MPKHYSRAVQSKPSESNATHHSLGNLEFPKNAVLSGMHRAMGNQMFGENDSYATQMALLEYNKSACLAEPLSENLGLAYGNRSAVYIRLGLYEACLLNIRTAVKNHYPREKMTKLKERMKVCTEKILKENIRDTIYDRVFDLPLSYPEKSNVPFIVDCLQLKNFPQYGNGIITTKDLRVGDVIIREKPATVVFECNDFAFLRCNFCGEEPRELITCDKCAAVLFCSETCFNEGREKYHKHECSIVNGLNKLCLVLPILQVTTRVFWLGLNSFNGDLNALVAGLKSFKDKSITAFDINYNNKSPTDDFFAIYSLKTGVNNYVTDPTEEAKRLLPILMQSESLKTVELSEPDGMDQLIDLLKNLINISAVMPFHGEDFVRLYSLAALINHSCAPNVEALVNNIDINTTHYIVKRPIREGEQIFIAYGMESNDVSLQERKSTMLKKLGFSCNCEACTKGFPTLDSIEECATLAKELKKIGRSKSRKTKLSLLRSFMQKHDGLYPKQELEEAWETYRNQLVREDE